MMKRSSPPAFVERRDPRCGSDPKPSSHRRNIDGLFIRGLASDFYPFIDSSRIDSPFINALANPPPPTIIIPEDSPMSPQQIAAAIEARFPGRLTASLPGDRHPRVHLDAADWRPIAEFLISDPALQLDWLANLSGVDYAADNLLCAVYDLWSFSHRHSFAIKVFTGRNAPAIPSVADLWPAADWHEREAFDLFGIDFPGHPDLRRILCADDWEGYPLRKDYVFPREYHGIPGSVELDWQHKPDYPK
jgi:NADH-quinone oxidoreductase subunit C